MDLFDSAGAVISDDGRYRYRLWRKWGEGKRLGFVMLNPSTADAEKDDPTIVKCKGHARANGFDGIEVVNCYQIRAPEPDTLKTIPEPQLHGEPGVTAQHVRAAFAECGMVVAAWGGTWANWEARPGVPTWWIGWFLARIAVVQFGLDVMSIRLTMTGQPWHPLYTSPTKDTLTRWDPAYRAAAGRNDG